MPETTFRERLDTRARAAGSLLCVGLDPDIDRFPPHLRPPDDTPRSIREALVAFAAGIVDATADLVGCYKPNLGFFLPYGGAGVEALVEIRRRIPPDIPVILDAKVGDVGNTAARYARAYFDAWGFDAVTVHPYLGEESLAPFLGHGDRGVIVLARTSNPSAGEFQDIRMSSRSTESDVPLYVRVAEHAAAWDSAYPASVGLVVGATYPDELAVVRETCPDLPILLPGIGAQDGYLERSVAAGIDRFGAGLMVSASRAVIYAGDGGDYDERARQTATELRDAINAARAARAASSSPGVGE